MAKYVNYQAVRQLLEYAQRLESNDYPKFEEVKEWVEELKMGAYQECIDLFATIEAQYRANQPWRKYPYSAVRPSFGFEDDYEGAPPAVHLVMCQDEAKLAEEYGNFVAEEDYPALYKAIKTWDVGFLELVTVREDGWDFSLVGAELGTEPELEPEPGPEVEPEPEPKDSKPTPDTKPESTPGAKPIPDVKPKPPISKPTPSQQLQPVPWGRYFVAGTMIFAGVWVFTRSKGN